MRHKTAAARNSPTHGPNRIRRVRRSTEALVESRRRAIMTATATIPRPEGYSESTRQNFEERQQQLDEMQRRMEERHALQHSLGSSWHRARIVRAREQAANAASNPSSQEPTSADGHSQPGRERVLQRFLDRIRSQDQPVPQGSRAQLEPTGRLDAASAGRPTGARHPLHVRPAAGSGGLRDENRLWYEYIISRSRAQAAGGGNARDQPPVYGLTPLASDPTSMTTAIADGMDRHGDGLEPGLWAALDGPWADTQDPAAASQPDRPAHRQRPRATAEHYVVEGLPDAMDQEGDRDRDHDRDGHLSRQASRRAWSLRRVAVRHGRRFSRFAVVLDFVLTRTPERIHHGPAADRGLV